MTVTDRVIDRARGIPPLVVDGAIGVAILVAVTLPNPTRVPASELAADVAFALSVTIRRRKLGAACGLLILTGVVGLITHSGYTEGTGFWLAGLILLYTVAERGSALTGRVALPAWIVMSFIFGRGHLRRLDLIYDAFVFIPWIGVAWFAGRAQARRRAIASDLERSAQELRSERELLVRSAVAAERAGSHTTSTGSSCGA